MNEIIKQQKPEFVSFLNSIDDKILKAKVELKTIELDSLWGNTYTETGRILKELQDEFANYNGGTFLKYLEVIGLQRQTAYNLINRYNYVFQNLENSLSIEQLPLSLSYEISKPSAPAQLVAQVLDGDITSHKQYKELEAKLKETAAALKEEKRVMEYKQGAINDLKQDVKEQEEFLASKEALIKTLLDKIDEGTETIKYVESPELLNKVETLQREIFAKKKALQTMRETQAGQVKTINELNSIRQKETEINAKYAQIEELKRKHSNMLNQMDETSKLLKALNYIKTDFHSNFAPVTSLNFSEVPTKIITNEINIVMELFESWLVAINEKFNLQFQFNLIKGL